MSQKAANRAKRQRSDTATADIIAYYAASQVIEPPKPLDNQELDYWRAITKARALDDWTAIDLLHAWNLSKLMAQIENSHQEIATNGMTIMTEKGTPIDNPAFSRLEKLTRLATTLSVKLHIHAEATVGRSEDTAKRATKQRAAENHLSSLNEHELSHFIARPQ